MVRLRTRVRRCVVTNEHQPPAGVFAPLVCPDPRLFLLRKPFLCLDHPCFLPTNGNSLRTQRNPASLPLRLEPKLVMVSIGKRSNARNQKLFQSLAAHGIT